MQGIHWCLQDCGTVCEYVGKSHGMWDGWPIIYAVVVNFCGNLVIEKIHLVPTTVGRFLKARV